MNEKPTAESLTEMIRREMGDHPKPGEHVFKCREGAVPFSMPASMNRKKADPKEGGTPETRAAREKDAASDSFIVRGVASSTSVDWYGTEMSLSALEDMQNQFNAGVDLFPRHGGFLDSVDWDEVIGRTFQGVLQRDQVAAPADASEPGFILSIEARVDRSAPRADRLEQRLDGEAPIGLSIGGWFLEVRYITDDEGELTRIIVERVLLDHVAVVRSPANPDSMGLELLRKAGEAVFSRAAEAPETAPEGAPETRSTDASEEVTQVPSLDRTPNAGDNAGDTGELPDDELTRSQVMENEKLDQVLALLSGIKETQDRSVERLDTLEARESTPEPAPEPAPADVTIEPLDVGAAIARGIDEAVKAMEARAAAATPEPAPAPAAPVESAEMAELRKKVEAMEAREQNHNEAIANMIGSGRTGRGTGAQIPVLGGGYDGDLAEREIDFLVKESRETAGVLCAVVTRHKKNLTVVREMSGHLPKGVRGQEYLQAAHNAPHILRSLCVAAETDGLIGDLDHGWRR